MPTARPCRNRASGSYAFVADMADGPVKQALSTVPALRSLIATGSGHLRLSELALVDDEDKTQARLGLRLMLPMAGPALRWPRCRGCAAMTRRCRN